MICSQVYSTCFGDYLLLVYFGCVCLPVPKLDDANWAGSNKSLEFTLILTEGDSAKSFAVVGLSVIGRDRYGVYPLRGKLLNVRTASHDQVRALFCHKISIQSTKLQTEEK